MIDRFARWVIGAAFVSAALSLPACAGGSSTSPSPQGPQVASTRRAQLFPAATCRTGACIYVTNAANTLTVYPARANGNVTPIRAIKGSKTELNFPAGIAWDAGRNVYVPNEGANSVTVYATGAKGDVAPIREIKGSRTGLFAPLGIALDNSGYGYVYVPNEGADSVTVYAAGANGDAPPIRTIGGSKTQLHSPLGVALDAGGNIYVSNYGTYSSNGSVTVYAAGTNGNVAPIQTITGSNTGLVQPSNIALDANRNVYVTNSGYLSGPYSVTVYAAGANGNIAPIRTIEGSNTRLNEPNGVALGPSGNIYVTNYGADSVTVYAAGVNGNVAPIRTISGSNTGLSPRGIVVR
jgi:6-phosphogluconolactonase (cycloisomerase 2 family)